MVQRDRIQNVNKILSEQIATAEELKLLGIVVRATCSVVMSCMSL